MIKADKEGKNLCVNIIVKRGCFEYLWNYLFVLLFQVLNKSQKSIIILLTFFLISVRSFSFLNPDFLFKGIIIKEGELGIDLCELLV